MDSTAILAEIGDVAWLDRLEGFFDLLHGTVESSGGVCFEHTGDGALVLFKSARSSIKSMLEVCAICPLLTGLEVSVAVHTGKVIFHDDNLVGLAIHTTSRIQDRAKAGQVLVSNATAQITKEHFVYQSRGLASLRGIPHPVELLEALDPKTASPVHPEWQLQDPPSTPFYKTSSKTHE